MPSYECFWYFCTNFSFPSHIEEKTLWVNTTNIFNQKRSGKCFLHGHGINLQFLLLNYFLGKGLLAIFDSAMHDFSLLFSTACTNNTSCDECYTTSETFTVPQTVTES